MKNNLSEEIKSMLSEQKLEYLNDNVVQHLKGAAENMVIKILKSATALKDADKELSKEDINLAVSLERINQREVEPVSLEILQELASEVNSTPIVLKDSCGLRLPKEHLGNCNYQIENPNKKRKMEIVNKYENYGNCFTFLMPQKSYKPHNVPSYMFKNPQNMRDLPMKITIRPKFNIQQNVALPKK